MWILISETILFGILLSFIVGYFGGLNLFINDEVKYKAIVQKTIENIDKKSLSNSGIYYKVERVIANNDKINSKKYIIHFYDKEGNIITGDRFSKLISDIYGSNVDTSNNGNINDKLNLSDYIKLDPQYCSLIVGMAKNYKIKK